MRLGSLLALLLLLPSCKRASPEPRSDSARPSAAASTKDPLPALLSALAAASTPPPPPAPALTAAIQALSDEEKGGAAADAKAREKARSETRKIPAGACPVETTRPAQKGEVVASWTSLWKRLGDAFQAKFEKPYPTPAVPVTTDAEVRHALTGALDDGKRLWVVELEDAASGFVQWHVVALLPDGKLLLFPSIAERRVGRCRTGPWAAWLEEGEMPRVVVESITNELGYMCENGGGEMTPCKFEEPDPKPVQSYCAPGTYSMRWLFVDVQKHEIPLVLEETGSEDGRTEKTSRVTLAVEPDGVMLAGHGCSGKVPFRL